MADKSRRPTDWKARLLALQERRGETAAMRKEAATALRRLIKLVPQPSKLDPGYVRHNLMLGGKEIGRISGVRQPTGFQIRYSEVDPQFQGMGLGKKMYGDLLKQLGGKPLLSDASVSPEAQRVWQSMAKRPDSYTVRTNPAAQIVPGATALADPTTIRMANSAAAIQAKMSAPLWRRLLGLTKKPAAVPETQNNVFEATPNWIAKSSSSHPRSSKSASLVDDLSLLELRKELLRNNARYWAGTVATSPIIKSQLASAAESTLVGAKPLLHVMQLKNVVPAMSRRGFLTTAAAIAAADRRSGRMLARMATRNVKPLTFAVTNAPQTVLMSGLAAPSKIPWLHRRSLQGLAVGGGAAATTAILNQLSKK